MPDGASTSFSQLSQKELLEFILIELRIMNLHLKVITEEELIEGELNDNH